MLNVLSSLLAWRNQSLAPSQRQSGPEGAHEPFTSQEAKGVGGWGERTNREIVSFRSCVHTRGLVV